MEECVDGEYQDFKSKNGAYIRKNFFGRHPETAALVADWTDDQIWALTRGGHDPIKVYAAYKAAAEHKGKPTVILAKTVKGYGMGEAGEGQMITHQQKKIGEDALQGVPRPLRHPDHRRGTDQGAVPALPEDSAEAQYLQERRAALGGPLPARRRKVDAAGNPAARRLRRAAAGDRRGPRDLHHDGVRAHPDDAAARQEHRPARRADRAGREPHLRHGGPVPADRHLQPGRPALSAAGRRPADVLPRGSEGADPAGGHQRARRDGLVHRRGDVLFDVQHAR